MNELLYGDNAREMLTTANAGADASFDPPNQNQMDPQLVQEFVGNMLAVRQHRDPDSIGVSWLPWSQVDAVLRRLGVEF